MVIGMKNLVNSSAYKAKVYAALTGVYCTMMSVVPALAGPSDSITAGISTGAQQIWNILVAVVAPIAAVALAICAIKILWGGQRAAEEAKGTAIKIVIGIALVLLAPSLVGAVRNWFASSSNWSFT